MLVESKSIHATGSTVTQRNHCADLPAKKECLSDKSLMLYSDSPFFHLIQLFSIFYYFN